MNNKIKQTTRVERFGVWLASTKFGKTIFTSKKNIIIFLMIIMISTHSLYWFTAWWSPWPYIIFMLSGVLLGQGIFSQYSIIIKQSMIKEWDPTILKVAIPFILLNWAAFFACLYMFGEIHDSSGNQILGTWNHFYFSVVTLTTLGYGNLVPGDFTAELIAIVESLVGFMGFAVLAGIIASIVFKRSEF